MARYIFVTATQLAANATFTQGTTSGAIIDTADGSNGGDWSRIGAQVNSDQAGTMYLDGSFDGTVWRQAGSVAVTANVPADLDLPLRFRYYRVRYVNGATITGAGNFAIHASLRG